MYHLGLGCSLSPWSIFQILTPPTNNVPYKKIVPLQILIFSEIQFFCHMHTDIIRNMIILTF